MPFLRRLFAFLRNLIRISGGGSDFYCRTICRQPSRRPCWGIRRQMSWRICWQLRRRVCRRRRWLLWRSLGGGFFGTSIVHLAFFRGNIPPFTATLVTIVNVVLLVIFHFPSIVNLSSIGTRFWIVSRSFSVRFKFDGKMPSIARPFLFLVDINYITFPSCVHKSLAAFFNSIMKPILPIDGIIPLRRIILRISTCITFIYWHVPILLPRLFIAYIFNHTSILEFMEAKELFTAFFSRWAEIFWARVRRAGYSSPCGVDIILCICAKEMELSIGE